MNAPLSPHEDMFWNTPAAAAKTLRFTDNLLMDEHVDLGDISTTSFASPPPFTKGTLLSAHNFMNNGEPDHHETDVMDWDASEEPPEDNSNMLHDSILSHDEDVYEPEELEEKTIVLKKIASSTRPESPEPLSTAINAKSLPVSPRVPGPLESPNTKHPKIRVNSEVERIVVGDPYQPCWNLPVNGRCRSRFGLRPVILSCQDTCLIPLAPVRRSVNRHGPKKPCKCPFSYLAHAQLVKPDP